MKTLYASAEGALQPGQTADVPPKLGKALVAGGYAVEGKDEFSPADADAANQKKAAGRRGGRPAGKSSRGAAADDGIGDESTDTGDEGTGDGDPGTGDDGDDEGTGDGDPRTGDGDEGTGDGPGSQD